MQFCGERMDKELSDLILISCLNERCGKISRGKLCRVAKKDEKLSSGHRTGKCQFSFQFQRKAMPKNAQTTAQLHSSHTPAK